jgi:hypothetical protein
MSGCVYPLQKRDTLSCCAPVHYDLIGMRSLDVCRHTTTNRGRRVRPCQTGSTPNAYVPSKVRPVEYWLWHPSLVSLGSHTHLVVPKNASV